MLLKILFSSKFLQKHCQSHQINMEEALFLEFLSFRFFFRLSLRGLPFLPIPPLHCAIFPLGIPLSPEAAASQGESANCISALTSD